jgi:hypothetical protein
MTLRTSVLLALGGAAVTACSGGTVDPGVPEAKLTIIPLEENHPDYFNTEATVWAKRGTEVEAALYFKNSSGGRGEVYARLRVRAQSLKAYPDGRAFSEGDSVLITLQAPPTDQVVYTLMPSGLQFSAGQPAELKLQYAHCEKDLNHDGVINASDADLQRRFSIWRQAMANSSFIKLSTANTESLQELTADVLGFSRFAIAY